MNRSTTKSTERRWWADLRNDKVDGHFFPRKKRDRRLGRLVEEALAVVLGVLRQCRHQEGGFEAVE